MAQEPQIPTAGAAGSPRPLRVVVLADKADRDAIRPVIAGVTEPQLQIQEADPGTRESAGLGPTDVVMFVFHKGLKPPVAHVTASGSERPVRIAMVGERSAHAIREALREGAADEVLFLPLDSGDVARALLKISETRRAPVQPAAKGRVISLVSVTGGAGVTTMAANCALAMAHSARKRVGLIDLDFQSGDLAVALNLEPERSVLDLNDSSLRLNSVQVESALTRHPSGVYLLAAPARIEESERISAVQVGAVLDLMREMVDVVIVDIGRHIGDVSVVVWEHSDELIYVIDQSIGAMRGAWRFLDLFGRLNLGALQPRFVLNRWSARHPINEKQIINTLGRPLAGRIPRDDKTLETAQARGDDLWKVAAHSVLAHSYEVLAREISGIDRGKRKPAGLLSKIFTRNGARPRS